MIVEKGDMWSMFGKTDLFLITTNTSKDKAGDMVMGRGIALEAKLRYPSMPTDFAVKFNKAIDTQAYDDALHPLHVGWIGKYEEQVVGWFITKYNWRQNSSLDILQRSCRDLARLAEIMYPKRIDLNFPGIGYGKLEREDVLPLLQILPDNVHVWEYEDLNNLLLRDEDNAS